jgi:acid phosphatase
VSHPSLPNYLAAAAGDYFDYRDDESHDIDASHKTVVDLLEAKGLTWRTYQEDMPSVCYTGSSYRDLYYRKHNPFISFESVTENDARCKNIVPSTQLRSDLQAGYLPNYSFYTPNNKNNGHDTTVAFASKWLRGFLTPLLSNPVFNNNTLVIVAFDEADDDTDESNHVLGLLLGSAVQNIKGTVDNTFYTQYSLISTLTANWGLGNLGRNDINKPLSNVLRFVAAKTGYRNVAVTNPPDLN